MTDLNFHEKVVKLQSELKAPKNQYNNFGKYKYRSCEDIVEGVKPLAKELGLILLISDELVLIGDRYYIKATATLKDSENYISANGYAREAENKKGMDSSQLTGATSSYARKYALNGLLAIDDTKDADDLNKHGHDESKGNQSTKASKKQVNFINTLLDNHKKPKQTRERMYAKYKVESVNELTKSQASEIIKLLNKEE